MFNPRIPDEDSTVPGMVIGVLVGVNVGGTCPVVSKRTMVGPVHVTLSLVATPVARIVKIKRTFCPASGARFKSKELFFLSLLSRHDQNVFTAPVAVM